MKHLEHLIYKLHIQLITHSIPLFAFYLLEDQQHERRVENPYLHAWLLPFGPFVFT